MRYKVTIEGLGGLIMHDGAAGLDTRSAANIEKASITRKKGSNRTEVDDKRLRELDCQVSLWLNVEGAPTIPEGAIRSMIETAARKLKQGPQVREGLVVEAVTEFDYDSDELGTTVEELGKSAQFTVGVVVQRARVLRTRARFEPWGCTFVLDCDDELVDLEQLEGWLDIGGRRIGLGDWRPEKSGSHGRFEVASIQTAKNAAVNQEARIGKLEPNNECAGSPVVMVFFVTYLILIVLGTIFAGGAGFAAALLGGWVIAAIAGLLSVLEKRRE